MGSVCFTSIVSSLSICDTQTIMIVISLVFLACLLMNSSPSVKADNGDSTVSPGAFNACPDDWLDVDRLGCYKFLPHKHNLSWVEAEAECDRIGGYLAEPDTFRKGNILHNIALLEMDGTDLNTWYLGLTDMGYEGHWEWIHSRQLLTDSTWAKHRPISKPGNMADCVVMVINKEKRSYSWMDVSCTNANPLHAHPICQRDVDDELTTVHTTPPITYTTPTTSHTTPMTTTESTLIPTSTTPPNNCPSGYTVFNSHCYKLYSDFKKNYDTSEAKCVADGGHLASVHSEEENEFLVELAGKEELFWMGGKVNSNSDGWIWMDGTPWDYENIGSGAMYHGCLTFSHYKWIPYPCGSLFYSICKI